MSRATTWISRSARGLAMNAVTAAAVTSTAATAAARLANEHPRQIHHGEAGEQPRHDRHAGEALDHRASAGDLLRQLIQDLGDGAGAETETEDRHGAGVDEAAHPRAGDGGHAADQAKPRKLPQRRPLRR